MALIETLVVPPLVILPLVGLRVILVIHPTITVSDWVPVMEGFCVAVAVTVADPVDADVIKPLPLIVATDWGLTLQVTAGFPVLPSLKVPTANIWTVLFVLPVCILGDAGPTARDVKVGFTKNPLQLAAKASATSAAKAPINRSFCGLRDMVVGTPGARPGCSVSVIVRI